MQRHAKLKLDHAERHLERLEGELLEDRKFNPFEVIRERDDGDGTYVYRAQVNRAPPDVIGLLIGDVIHNLRSALDHRAWELATRVGDPPGDTEFPIFLEDEKYRSAGTRKVRGLPIDAQTVIEGFQPYHGSNPELHLLWVLHQLNNLDKHRTVAVVGMQTRIPVKVTHVSEDELEIGYVSRSFTAGDELVRIPVDDVERQKQVEDYVWYRVSFDPAEAGRGAGVIEGLTQIHGYIATQVFPALA